MSERRGVIYAATGAPYVRMAEDSARSLRAQCPDLPIDLFTDQSVSNDLFDRIVQIDGTIPHPKLEAMLQTRFEQTLFLDTDTFITADISDIFFILDRFDLAAAHDQYRNSQRGTNPLRMVIPNAFPQYNSGVVAFNRTDSVMKLLTDWRRTTLELETSRDQPTFRELLYLSDLRIATLPEEYNLMKYDAVVRWTNEQSAPRIIHHRSNARWRGNGGRITRLRNAVGWKLARHIRLLSTTDRQLASKPSGHQVSPIPFHIGDESATTTSGGFRRWLQKPAIILRYFVQQFR